VRGPNLSPYWRMIKMEEEKEMVKLLEELFSEMKLITKWQKEFGDKVVKLAADFKKLEAKVELLGKITGRG
jgi:hypothetical protein